MNFCHNFIFLERIESEKERKAILRLLQHHSAPKTPKKVLKMGVYAIMTWYGHFIFILLKVGRVCKNREEKSLA